MITLHNVTFAYEDTGNIFKSLNLELNEPGIYGLLGENGIGKTTLLKLMSAVYFAIVGEIKIDDKDVSKRDVETMSKIYFMPDTISDVNLTFDNFVKCYSPFYENFSKDILDDCLKSFGIDSSRKISAMSLGEKKKAFMSFALAVQTEILLMDEPSNGMDITSKKIFRQLLMKYCGDEQYIIISTHLVSDVENILDHFIILTDKENAFSASSSEITERYTFGTSSSAEGALYAEKSAGGYKVIMPNEGEESEIDITMLFNAVIKGAIK